MRIEHHVGHGTSWTIELQGARLDVAPPEAVAMGEHGVSCFRYPAGSFSPDQTLFWPWHMVRKVTSTPVRYLMYTDWDEPDASETAPTFVRLLGHSEHLSHEDLQKLDAELMAELGAMHA